MKTGKTKGEGKGPKDEVIKKIKNDALERLPRNMARKTNLFMEKNPLRKGHEIQAGRKKIPVERDTMMVFADEAPLYNWGHPCRYLFYSLENGEMQKEIKAEFPPYLVNVPETFTPFHEPVVSVEVDIPAVTVKPWWKWLDCPFGIYVQGKRYAILFSGGSNYRHVNDLEFMYRTLIHVYNFKPENIYVLNYDGKINYNGSPKPVGNWPGDNTAYQMPVNAEGTKSELENVIDDLKARIKHRDLLFIHTNNHGGGLPYATESYLCTHSGSDYDASDFAAKLAELPSFSQLIVMMEQCHSGGFATPIINNSPANYTSFAAACLPDKGSTGGNGIFDPFARDWIAAMNGANPYGAALSPDPDTDNDGIVSAREAFVYADTVKHPVDTPVYDETPPNCGDNMHLGELDAVCIVAGLTKYLERYRELHLIEPPIPGPSPGPDPAPYVYDKVVKSVGLLGKTIGKELRAFSKFKGRLV